jgi:hypothetical protein
MKIIADVGVELSQIYFSERRFHYPTTLYSK